MSSRDTIDADSVKDICDICKNANSSVNSFIRVCCESYDVSKPYCHKLEAQSYPDVLLRSISPKYVFFNKEDNTVFLDLEDFEVPAETEVLGRWKVSNA